MWGVRWVTGAISLLLGGLGLFPGPLGRRLRLDHRFQFQYGIGLILGIGLGGMIFLVLAMVATVISSYTMTAYDTSVFLWARDVREGQVQARPCPAPAPLAATFPLAVTFLQPYSMYKINTNSWEEFDRLIDHVLPQFHRQFTAMQLGFTQQHTWGNQWTLRIS